MVNRVVRFDIKMQDYCNECSYTCCGGCNTKKEWECNPSTICNTYPFLFSYKGYFKGYFGPFGVVGKTLDSEKNEGWIITGRCKGPRINELRAILSEFKGVLESCVDITELTSEGVHLSVIDVTPEEVNKKNPNLYKTLQNFL